MGRVNRGVHMYRRASRVFRRSPDPSYALLNGEMGLDGPDSGLICYHRSGTGQARCGMIGEDGVLRPG